MTKLCLNKLFFGHLMSLLQLQELYNNDCEGMMFIEVSIYREWKEGRHDTQWRQCHRIRL